MKLCQLLILAVCNLLIVDVFALDIEPRRWTTLPKGMKVIGAGYGNTTGDVFFDPVLNVENATVEVNTVVGVYVQSFSLAGKQVRFDALVPWQQATWDGLLNGEETTVRRDGFADPRLRLSFNFIGAPSSSAKELRNFYASNPTNTVAGVAIAVTLPLGDYHDDKLLNLGNNRYSIRPQIGMVHNRGPWSFELTSSAIFYTDNNDFFNNGERKQDPLYAVQTHLIHVFKPGFWGSLSAGYAKGRESTINGVEKNDQLKQLLRGISLGIPISRFQSIKLRYINSRTLADTGADTQTLGLGWSMVL